MSKQKLWVKKRTSRGNGRSVNHRSQPTVRNIDRDIRKNQQVYSLYLLKFVALFALGLLWLRLGVQIGPLTALPIGLVLGLIIVLSEQLAATRHFELCLLLAACILSYLLPIGVVI